MTRSKRPVFAAVGVMCTAIGWLDSARVSGQATLPVVVVDGATVIDGTGAPPLGDAVILIRGKRIEAVGRRGTIQVPADARTVDARGKFIVPGFIDAHAHFRENWMDELFLLHGVTSVMAEGAQLDWDLAQQDAREKGRIRGPRFYTAGQTFRCADSIDCAGPEWQPDRVRQRVQAFAKAGVRKIAVGQHQPPDVLRIIVDEAHKNGLPVSGETFYIREASAFGWDAVVHTYAIAMGATPDDVRAKIVKAIADGESTDLNPLTYLVPPASTELRDRLLHGHVYLVPMLVNDFKAVNDRVNEIKEESRRLLDDPQLDYIPAPDLSAAVLSTGPRGVPALGPSLWFFGTGFHGTSAPRAKQDEPHRRNYRNVMNFVGEYAAAGGRILAGTDVGNYVMPGLSVLHEMELLHDAGLTSMQALQAATLWGAEFLHRDAEIGSIRPGRLADLVILDANPLDDIANVKRIRSVFLNGLEQDMTYHRDYRNPIPVPGRMMAGPSISSLSPTTVVEGRGVVELTLRGRFIRESIATVDDVRVPTTFVSGGRLVASVPGTFLDRPGTLTVKVVNPAGFPRGGVSEPVYLIVRFK